MANKTLVEILGYDPFDYYGLQNSRRDIAYLLFGGCVYESADCAALLLRSWSRRGAPIFWVLVAGLLFNASATLSAIKAYSSGIDVIDDYFRKPAEFVGLIAFYVAVALAKCAYFYGTMIITLAVYPTHTTMRRLIRAATALGALGFISFLVVMCHFSKLTLDQYVIYTETKDGEAVMDRMNTVVIPFAASVAESQLVSAATLLMFVAFTKVAFVWQIFKSLEVPLYEAAKTIMNTPSTLRIFTSGLWSVAEVLAMWTVGLVDVTVAIGLFSLIFQLNTLAMLAFQGSKAIVHKYSSARLPATVDLSLQMRTRASAPEPETRFSDRQVNRWQENA